MPRPASWSRCVPLQLLEQIAGRHREWWFFDTDPAKEFRLKR